MKLLIKNQQGYGALVIIIAILIGISVGLIFFPLKYPEFSQKNKGASPFCRPYVEANGDIKPNAPTIMAPSYDGSVVRRGYPFPEMNRDDIVPYRLIKSRVPLKSTDLIENYSTDYLHDQTPNNMFCKTYEYNGDHHSHFCQWIHKPLKIDPNFSGAYAYVVMYPAPYSDGNATDRYIGASDPFNSEIGSDQVARYGTYHLLFLLHVDQNNQPYVIANKNNNNYLAFDIYQQVQEEDQSKPVTPLPENILKCLDGAGSDTGMKMGQIMENSPDKKQLQWGWFLFTRTAVDDTWYEPACKPAINLYPEKDMVVNVKVTIPHGFLTYTDPVYPKNNGWSVLAHPNGQLQYLDSNRADSKGITHYPSGLFPYLYYEGKVHDAVIQKPTTGFVTPYEQLPTLYKTLLPKLGLNEKETKEFTDYWTKALPNSPYYFVGIIPQEQINTNEPLIITPQQDTLIRVRLYFEALATPKNIQEPKIQTPTRNGFTVIDWGGMMKQDKNHPFTCLQ